jgi:hypothetical protein
VLYKIDFLANFVGEYVWFYFTILCVDINILLCPIALGFTIRFDKTILELKYHFKKI